MKIILAAVLALAVPLAAQNATGTTTTTTTPAAGFTTQAGPIAFEYQGAWSAGSFTAERYDVYDFGATKANHLSIDGIQVLAPTPGINMYLGGVDYVPNLSSLMSKLNVPAASFTAFVDGAIGPVTFSNAPNSIAWMAGGGVAYKITSSLTWTPIYANYGRAGSQPFVGITTNLRFLFGK